MKDIENLKNHSSVRLYIPEKELSLVPQRGILDTAWRSNHTWWDIHPLVYRSPDKGFHLSHNGEYISDRLVQVTGRGHAQAMTANIGEAATFVVGHVNDKTKQYALLKAHTHDALGIDGRGTLGKIHRLHWANEAPFFQHFTWAGEIVTLTQRQLDEFKKHHPNNPQIQAVTLADILKNTQGKVVDWGSLKEKFQEDDTWYVSPNNLTECEIRIGFVIFDLICLILGATGLRSGVSRSTVESVAQAAKPVMNKLAKILEALVKPDVDVFTWAKGVFDMAKAIYSAGLVGAVFSAFLNSLSWWDGLLYGVAGVATIVALVATDGLAFAAEVVLVLASFAWLVTDAVRAYTACSGDLSLSAAGLAATTEP